MYFFFNDTATTEIYTLSLHDALPIYHRARPGKPRDALARYALLRHLHLALAAVHGHAPAQRRASRWPRPRGPAVRAHLDRKSTRLNSSHSSISYAVFCLKKKKKTPT